MPDLVKILDRNTVDAPKLQVPNLNDTLQEDSNRPIGEGEIIVELLNQVIEDASPQPSFESVQDESEAKIVVFT